MPLNPTDWYFNSGVLNKQPAGQNQLKKGFNLAQWIQIFFHFDYEYISTEKKPNAYIHYLKNK